jgi:PiT family inorganic phosphate transporter
VVVGIVASWILSPLLGGLLAASFLYLIKRNILRRVDMAAAARRAVPRMLGIMAGIFTAFLIIEGLRHLLPGHQWAALGCGLAVGGLGYVMVRRRLLRPGHLLANTRQGVNRLFRIPLIFAAAIMSFAHGSNDVANAVGPLAAIVHVVTLDQGVALPALVPFWVLLVGALGIAGGLVLFGPRVIRTIGTELTELDNLRAFSVALASALTVILASVLGLPVSTTHVVVGAVLGVGFLREYLNRRHHALLAEIRARHPGNDQSAIEDFMQRFEAASVDGKAELLKELKKRSKLGEDPAHFTKAERKTLRSVYRQELVKRSQLRRILAAWVVTLPASALMAAALFHLLRSIGLS